MKINIKHAGSLKVPFMGNKSGKTAYKTYKTNLHGVYFSLNFKKREKKITNNYSLCYYPKLNRICYVKNIGEKL